MTAFALSFANSEATASVVRKELWSTTTPNNHNQNFLIANKLILLGASINFFKVFFNASKCELRFLGYSRMSQQTS